MRVAVDYQSVFGRKTGIGVAAERLVTSMVKQAPDIDFLLYEGPHRELRTAERVFWESGQVPLKALKDKADLVYSPGFSPAMWGLVPRIVTVHDLIGMAFRGNQRAVSSFYWSRWLPAAVRRARRVVASSEHTRRDIEKFLAIPPAKVSVVPLGADPAFRRLEDRAFVDQVLAKYCLRGPYIISVGTLEPRKNHWRLLQAYAELKRRRQNDFSLLIVGKDGGMQAKLRSFVKEEGLDNEVRFAGYVELEELICLYNGALGYAMISLYEGFGLPVLEAMSCGLSGVCSARTSLPEIAGDTALLVDPEEAQEIAEALREYSSDARKRESLSQAALERSKSFSYESCAKTMIEIFKNEVS